VVAIGCSFATSLRSNADEPGATAAPQPERDRLRPIVETLASPEFGGRSGEGGKKTAAYLIAEFQRLGLAPLFGTEYLQEIPEGSSGRVQGRNVGAVLKGTDPQLADEWLVVAAHYDHLGQHGEVLYPGADDNASGVAMMLETARCLTAGPNRPRRSVMFIGFDLEEIGLFGSRYFVAHPPMPIERIRLMLCADMIGRSLAGVCDSHVFVLGSEHAPGLRPWIESARAREPLTLGLLGSDILILNRSDYGPFRNRSVPYLFFTTGENPRYHSPRDTPDTLDYDKLASISRMIHRIALKAATSDDLPACSESPDHPLAEAITIRDVLRELLKNRENLEIGAASLFLMNNTVQTLDAIVERGVFTQAERARVIQVARVILISVL
jgi:hypothetical protein